MNYSPLQRMNIMSLLTLGLILLVEVSGRRVMKSGPPEDGLKLQRRPGDQYYRVEFSCTGRHFGFYADLYNDCQTFHICIPQIELEATIHYLIACGEGLKFDQQSMECKLAKDVDCSKTENRQLTEENKSEKNKLPIIGTIGKFIGL